MGQATLTTLDKILKDFYLPPVVEQLNNDVLIVQRLDKSDKEIFGKQAIVPLHKGRSGAIGARGENIPLPAAGNQGYDRAVFDLKYLYGRVAVTGPSMAKTSSEAGAFLQALKSELDGIRSDLKKDTARQLYGTGDGKIATCGVTTASTTVVLASREPIDKGQLYVGQVIDVGTLANPVSRVAGATITAVTPATPSITIDSAITTAGTDFVFRQGSVTTSSVSYEISGLQQVVSTTAGSFGGIDASVAGNEWWDNLRDTAGGALALDTLMKAWNQVRRSGGETTAIITSLGLQRSYFNLLQSQVRYTEPTNIHGGFTVLEFMQKPLIADYEAPWGKMFFLDEPQLRIYTNRDWHFLDEDGNVLKWVTGFDKWEAVLSRYMNLGAVRRNTQMVVSGLTDTTGI